MLCKLNTAHTQLATVQSPQTLHIHAALLSSSNLVWMGWECEIYNSGWVMPVVGEQAVSHPARSGTDTKWCKTTHQMFQEQNELASVKHRVTWIQLF